MFHSLSIFCVFLATWTRGNGERSNRESGLVITIAGFIQSLVQIIILAGESHLNCIHSPWCRIMMRVITQLWRIISVCIMQASVNVKLTWSFISSAYRSVIYSHAAGSGNGRDKNNSQHPGSGLRRRPHFRLDDIPVVSSRWLSNVSERSNVKEGIRLGKADSRLSRSRFCWRMWRMWCSVTLLGLAAHYAALFHADQ